MSIVDSRYNTQRTIRIDSPTARYGSHAAHEATSTARASQEECIPSRYFAIKPVVECCLTFSLLIVALPLMSLLSACLLAMDGWPIFYRQVRVGKHGKQFHIWKFRTMRRDAEKHTGPVWCSQMDNRVTKIGRWLRATHLDELPQIINVIAGDMHLVGPRPERPEFVKSLSQEIPRYNKRHLVRPGITGLAQVNQTYDSCVGDVASKVALDIKYIESASFFRDIKIIVMTFPFVIREVGTLLKRKMPFLHWGSTTTQSPKPANQLSPNIEALIKMELDEQIAILTSAANSIPKPHLGTPIMQRETLDLRSPN